MELKLSRDDVSNYCYTNNNLISFYHIGSTDYIASRCCYHNLLFDQAYVMACQTIEKMLKAILICLNPNENIKRFNNHKLIPIINKIESLGNYNLENHSKIATKLWETYEMFRYPDNKLKGVYPNYSYAGDEIDLIDNFFFDLLDILPIPNEVKFRTGLYVSLYEEELVKHLKQQKYWITHKNKILAKKNDELHKIFLEVRKHLY